MELKGGKFITIQNICNYVLSLLVLWDFSLKSKAFVNELQRQQMSTHKFTVSSHTMPTGRTQTPVSDLVHCALLDCKPSLKPVNIWNVSTGNFTESGSRSLIKNFIINCYYCYFLALGSLHIILREIKNLKSKYVIIIIKNNLWHKIVIYVMQSY